MDINDWLDARDAGSEYFGMDSDDINARDAEYRRKEREKEKSGTAVAIHTVEQWEHLHKVLGLGGAYPPWAEGLYQKLLRNPPIYQAVDKQCWEYKDCENILSYEEAVKEYSK